jgi:hypothetical protein
LLKSYFKDNHGLVAYAHKYDHEKRVKYVKHMYWACKGACDSQLQHHCRITYDANTAWEDIGDIVIPAMFLRYILATINQLKSGRWIYDDSVFEKEKQFIMALSQKVLREATEEERKRTIQVITAGFL